MANRLSELPIAQRQKRQALHSIGVGSVFFLIICIYSKFCTDSLCVSMRLFHIPCAGCGLTRGFTAILQLDFKSAWEYNILSIPLFLGIVSYSVCAVIDMVFHKNTIAHIERFLTRKYMFVVYLILVIITTMTNHASWF